MELILKAAAAALTASFIALLLKKFNPELSGLLSLCTIAVIMITAVNFIGELKELIRTANRLAEISDIYLISILKCLAVSIVAKLSSDLCKDAGQAVLASAVEFAGCVCAATVVLPLIINMINLVGTMV